MDWITALVAIVGAITGIAGLWLSILNHRRDRQAVKVAVERGYLGTGGSDWDGPYIFVKAVNVGRRVVQLRSGGLILPGKDERLMIMPGPQGSPTSLPASLNESDVQQLWTLVDQVVGRLVQRGDVLPTHGYFDDSTGRRWTGEVPKGIRDELRDAMRRARA